MKVLELLRRAGIVSVEGASDEAAARRADPSPDRPDPKRGEGGASAEARTQHSIVMPAPPTAEQMAPLAARELTIDFAQIYAALKLPVPAHGWTVEKVQAALASPHFASLEAATKKAALLAMLDASNAKPDDIVQDAARRDQALDAYEQFARKKLSERQAGVRQAIAEEDERIRLAQQGIERHKQALTQEEQSFELWLKKKIEQEESLLRVVALLTDQTVISVGSAGDSNPGEGGAPFDDAGAPPSKGGKEDKRKQG